jgi:serine/threonine protein kinase
MNYNQIQYEQLRNIIVERSTPFLFWCGAGLSIEAGYPSWNELKKQILEDFEKEATDDQKSDISRIRSIPDLWLCFSKIKQLIGKANYEAYIRKYLDLKTDVPEIYEKLWSLDPRGIVTLNLDSLVTLGFNSFYRRGKRVNEFNGRSLKEHIGLIKTPDPFIVNMHGTINNSSSWVFTREDLASLQQDDGYNTFLSAIFSTFCVVFIGISAEDVAAGGVLNNFVEKLGLDLGKHFWITDSAKSEIAKWADKTGIGLIKYDKGKHGEVLEIINCISHYKSNDSDQEIILKKIDDQKNIDNSDIEKKTPNELRYFLNSALNEIIKNSDKNVYNEYFRFMEEHDEMCHRAWYIGKNVESKMLFDYNILDFIGRGGFGKVYKAISKTGDIVAIKILHEDIRDQKETLMCFRRGVKSLSILTERNITNIVKYIDATEIPLMLVMEYIDGPNLKMLIESGQCSDTYDILTVAHKITSIIKSAHNLPERVLHRDLRPTNIMFRNFYNTGEFDITITDFDFAWYKGAIEDSISRKPVSYLAPEQIDIYDKFSSRSTLIDSYALGMIFYFMISKKDPLYKNHLHSDWDQIVKQSCESSLKTKWKSLPFRFHRLIINLTKDKQNERWDISQAFYELERLLTAETEETSDYSELVAEELMARIITSSTYVCLEKEFEYQYANGLKIDIGFDEVKKNIEFRIIFQKQGNEHHANIKKFLPQNRERTISVLTKNGWKITTDSHTSQLIVIDATIQTSDVIASFEKNIIDLSNIKMDYNFN